MLLIILFQALAFSLLFSDEKPQKNVQLSTAIFAGGCFWCMQPPFDHLKGVAYTKAGYTGGGLKNPTYEQVSAGGTGHREAVEVFYDPAQITYDELLNVFWRNIDPLDNQGQFCDKGDQYRSAVFYKNEAEKAAAEKSRLLLIENGLVKAVYTDILPFEKFYEAEEYHQEYYVKNPLRYKFYRYACGRDKRLYEIWGKAIVSQ